MTLTKLKITNFKGIKLAELNLSDVNILVGTNGSGKSSIIQAVHLACCMMRQSNRVDKDKTSTVGVDELDYLPSNEYKMLGYRSSWGNKAGTSSSKVAFAFQKDATELSAHCELRSARNAGISISGSVPNELTDLLRKDLKFFSAYIPGISGIPNREEKKSRKVVLKACSYGDSNIILRNALLLLSQMDQQNITLIEDWIGQITGYISIKVVHNDHKDLSIKCDVGFGGTRRPIELIGTGYLQLIQLFSYILLFSPGILLIDEPDIHLHPTVQEKLVKVLASVAKERNIRILLTTHSPFIVRGSPPDANVYWVSDGKIESNDRRSVELALGWGAFGRKAILISEDRNTSLLRKLISQWPELEKFITFFPGTGFKSLATPDQAAEMREALCNKFKILVHRDRDSMTDDEVQNLTQQYESKGAYLWCPQLSDIEAYFCQSSFLAAFLGCSASDADAKVTEVLTRHGTPIRDQFEKQRAAHNAEFHRAGGSPTNDDVWNAFQSRDLKGAKGKFVFQQLQNIIPANSFRDDAVLKFALSGSIAVDLKSKLEDLLRD